MWSTTRAGLRQIAENTTAAAAQVAAEKRGRIYDGLSSAASFGDRRTKGHHQARIERAIDSARAAVDRLAARAEPAGSAPGPVAGRRP